MRDSQLPLRVIITIEIKFLDKFEMNAIMKALTPDNINFPKALSMQSFSKGNTLFFEFFCNAEIETLISTVDEVLNHISVAKKVINDD
jgi:hypothetical protein